MVRTVTATDLAEQKHSRALADRAYNDALTALDAAISAARALPHPPPEPDEYQVTPLNERWDVLAAAPPMPTGWRGRIARFIWTRIEPLFIRQQAFNSALVDHINRNIGIRRDLTRAVESTIELVRQQQEAALTFQSRLVVFAQHITPFVDTKDYEHARILRRLHEDNLERIERGEERNGDLRRDLESERQRADSLAAGLAGGLHGVSDEMLKRFESATTRLQRAEAGLRELSGAVSSVQQLAQTLRRDLERRPAGNRPQIGGPAGPSQPFRVDTAQQMLASDPIHSHQYVGFEDLYRGSEVDIQGRMADYVALFGGMSDVLDIGCGRGEFLKLLHEHGIPARGIDLNHEMVERCRADGLTVCEADALSYLSRLRDDELGGVIATQVVEHLPPDYLLRLLATAFDKLRPGGRLILETINPSSWAAFFDSYIRDLTHVRPVHPDTLKYLVTASGFSDATIVWRSPYPQESKLQPVGADGESAIHADPAVATLAKTFDRNVDRLNSLLFTHMDYAIVASRP